MHNIGKSLANNALAALTAKAPQGVVDAIKQASAKTGVNFAYMVQQASAESSFNPSAKAKTSSASGLYQFIESTWMSMVSRYGDKHGLDTENMSKREILDLRNDPQIASNMAAEFAGENERFLDAHWGGEVGSTELYFAHFMGAGGAASFLKSRDENPLQAAADLFPSAANANRNVFYERGSGRAKTLEEVYQFFDKKFKIEGDATTEVASANLSPEKAAQESLKAGAIIPAIDYERTASIQKMRQPGSIVFQNDFSGRSASKSYFTTAAVSNGSLVPRGYQNLLSNPIDLMLMAQLDIPLTRKTL